MQKTEIENQNQPRPTVYWLDNQDRIIRVSDTWDQFAADNEGEGVYTQDITGHTIWNFIKGDTTKMWLYALLSMARIHGQPVIRAYRCDSPSVKRYMSMCVIPEEAGVIKIEHWIVATEKRESAVHIYAAEKPSPKYLSSFLKRCSICGKVMSGNEWIEPDCHPEAVNNSRLTVIYGVCDGCLSLLPGFTSLSISS